MSVEKPEFGEVFEFKHASSTFPIKIVYLHPSHQYGPLGWVGMSLPDSIDRAGDLTGERIDLTRENWRSLDDGD